MSFRTPRLLEGAACLETRKDVVKEGDSYIALNDEPWLGFVSPAPFIERRFLELVYVTEICAEPVRPILRFWCGSGKFQDHIMPAPVKGKARWIGRAPRGLTDVWISPSNRRGAFKFAISSPRPVLSVELMRRLALSPKRLFFALAAGWVGLEEEAALNWRWALGAASILPSRELRQSAFDPDGFGLSESTGDQRFTLVIDVAGASSAKINDTCLSIDRQIPINTQTRLVGKPLDDAAGAQSDWRRRPDFVGSSAPLEMADNNLVMLLAAGDVLTDHALSCIASHFARHKEQKLAYGDEIRRDAENSYFPVFKPGWSPTLQQSTHYIGRAAAFRASLLESETDWINEDAEALVNRVASRLDLHEVGALRRPILVTGTSASRPISRSLPYPNIRPAVSIVIPTRDRADLLGPCVKSLFEKTTYEKFDVVLVDNDSVEPRTLALIDEMRSQYDRLKILPAPGDFNFSALSNAGAAACEGECLLFLNNDTQIVTPDWIERLVSFAARPDIGAVGAKLVYPNRKVQHVGVLLGMGGVAGHFGAGLDESDPGWFGRNLVPHEVSAVTGACLMVARRKFEAVGGFDELNLPVDLNDVDLCLRLAARGWRTICNSEVVLIHHQSASRGGGLRLQQVYERERRFFVERWRALIRDDPYFHPGLSLYSPTVMAP